MSKKIPLQNGMFAIVDDEDYERCRMYNWRIHGTDGYLYIETKISGRCVRLPYFILGVQSNRGKMCVSYNDNNTLNNRKKNLVYHHVKQRSVKSKGHRDSTSKYKGVSWDKERNKWVASIKRNGERLLYKRFDNEEEAALAYNKKILDIDGPSAFVNKIGEPNLASPQKHVSTTKTKKQLRTHSSYRGVSARDNKFASQIRKEKTLIYLGLFNTRKEAAKAYDKKAYELYGDKAILNFPEDYV